MAGVDTEMIDELLGSLDDAGPLRGRSPVRAARRRAPQLPRGRRASLGITAEAARRLVNRALVDAAQRRRPRPRRLTLPTPTYGPRSRSTCDQLRAETLSGVSCRCWPSRA